MADSSDRADSEEMRDLRGRYERLRALYHVGSMIHSTLDPQRAFQLIIDQAVGLVRATSGSIVLVNPTNGFLEILASHGLPDQATELKLRVGEGITGWVAATSQPARVGDVRRDKRYISIRPEVQSELAVPLEVHGETRGVLNVDSELPDAFTPEDQDVLEALAGQASSVIQNTWLHQQLQLKARLFESLATVSQTINSTLNLDDALRAITEQTCTLVRARLCSLRLVDDAAEWLDLRASFGAGASYLARQRLNVHDSLLGSVVRRKKPVQVENVQVSPLYQNTEIARAEGLFGLLSVPLLFRGEAIGTLSVYTDRPYSFSNEEVRIVSALAELSAIAIERARLYERVMDVEDLLRHNEKLSALGLLAAEVAHEIRNPLTVMKMLYHSLDLKFTPGDPRTRDAQIMGEKIDHLNRIVERILDFARTPEPCLSPLNVGRIIDDMILLVRHKLKQQGIELIRAVPADLPEVRADSTQLEQVFLNIILNAAEAMPQGGTLTISCRRVEDRTIANGESVAIEFLDTGHGMTEEHRSRAFDSVLSTTKPKGTGLGLAIVRRIVEAHKGRIEIHTGPEKGTRITLTLRVG